MSQYMKGKSAARFGRNVFREKSLKNKCITLTVPIAHCKLAKYVPRSQTRQIKARNFDSKY